MQVELAVFIPKNIADICCDLQWKFVEEDHYHTLNVLHL